MSNQIGQQPKFYEDLLHYIINDSIRTHYSSRALSLKSEPWSIADDVEDEDEDERRKGGKKSLRTWTVHKATVYLNAPSFQLSHYTTSTPTPTPHHHPTTSNLPPATLSQLNSGHPPTRANPRTSTHNETIRTRARHTQGER
jgi:hypothetical protein